MVLGEFVGVNIKVDLDVLAKEAPQIVVGTPGRILDLATRDKSGVKLDLSHVKIFIMDECDRMLSEISMRRDVQRIFQLTPVEKQTMMFSATLDKEIRPVCRNSANILWKFLLIMTRS